MRAILIDCEGATSASDFWQRYVDAAKPQGADLFGRNLDAFWDAIEHGGPGWPGDVKLVFINSAALAKVAAAGGPPLLDGLRRIADEATLMEIDLA
jgi:ribonuclease inhibitor